MDFLSDIWNKAKKINKTVVLPETEDHRVLKAAELILKSKLAKIVLIGNKENIEKESKAADADISNATITDPLSCPKTDRYIEIYMKKMKEHKREISFNEAKAFLEKDFPYFGAMMVAEGDADGMVSGASHSTGHTIKSAIYSSGLKEGVSTLSSFFVMLLQDKQLGSSGILFFADCAVVPDPDTSQLRDIAVSTAESFKQLMGKNPKIAMLSFSTKGSGRAASAEKVALATGMIREKDPELMVDGELQLDAALIPSIGRKKAPESKVAGRANVLIFPNLDAGNIGYKIAERIGGAVAIGPIFQGCAKPINDLSRGCSIDDIVNVTAITALQTL
ncbi:MAG: phosphate acetyltransferase [Candidatus Margulisiibacteriota bacterium]